VSSACGGNGRTSERDRAESQDAPHRGFDDESGALRAAGPTLAEPNGADAVTSPPIISPVPPSLPLRDGMSVRWVHVDRIEPDADQPRTGSAFEGLDRLGCSLRTHGQLQPVLLRPGTEPERFVIVHGERRWRAAQIAGLPVVAAVVLDATFDPSRLFEMQILENAMREDLSPIDQARAYRTLMDRNGWTAKRVAAALHVNPATVTRSLGLLDLPDDVRREIVPGMAEGRGTDRLRGDRGSGGVSPRAGDGGAGRGGG
jgi:ParB family transcriptional regulator, chromosome partitioning protein